MKELMLGNKAVARGLYEAGCCVISSYPGTPSTEITEEAALYPEIYCEWAPNEKVALEVAHFLNIFNTQMDTAGPGAFGKTIVCVILVMGEVFLPPAD